MCSVKQTEPGDLLRRATALGPPAMPRSETTTRQCGFVNATPLLAFSVATGGSSGSLGRESAFSAASSDLGHDLKNRGYNCVWLVGGNEVVTSRHDAPGPAQ